MGLRLDPDPTKRIRQLWGEGSLGAEGQEDRAMQVASVRQMGQLLIEEPWEEGLEHPLLLQRSLS